METDQSQDSTQSQTGGSNQEPSVEEKLNTLLAEQKTLQGQLDQMKDAANVAESKAAAAERLARRAQSKYDSLLMKQSGPPKTPAQQKLEDIDEKATDQQTNLVRENMFLRELARRGLSAEEVGEEYDLEQFQSPTELQLALDNFELKKRQKQLQEDVAKVKEAPPKPSVDNIDAGGPTDMRDSNQLSADEKTLDESYNQIRKRAPTQATRWELLRTIHKDPRKVISK